MQQDPDFQGTIEIRVIIGCGITIDDVHGYAWHGEHGVLEIVQDHGNRILFFPIATIREVIVTPDGAPAPQERKSSLLKAGPKKGPPAQEKDEVEIPIAISPGDKGQYWTECPVCETKTLYFRKKVGDYRCVTCKKVFTKEEVEH